MIEGPHAQPGVGRIVTDDDVEFVQGQLGQEPDGVAVDAGHQHIFTSQPYTWHQQPMDDQLAERVVYSNPQPQATTRSPTRDCIGQLPAQ